MPPPSMLAETDRPLREDAKVIGLVGVAHATSHFYHLLLVPLFPWLRESFGLSYGELGYLMTVFFLVSGVGQALAGFLVDRVGAFPVHLIGLSLLTASAIGLAASQSYGMLLGFEVVAGLGNAVFHPSGFTLLNKRVSVPRLGHAFSIHGITGTLGWAAAPLFLVSVASFAGWRVALLSAGGLAFSVLILLLVFRRALETRERDGFGKHPLAAPGDNPGLTVMSLLGILNLPSVWMCFSFFLITAMSNGGIQSFAPSALQEIYRVPVTMAMACITAYMLASAGGMIWGGFLAARLDRHEKIIAIAFSLAGMLSVVVASGVVPRVLTILLLGLIGFGSGIAGPSRDLMVRAASPQNATGRVYGLVYSGLDIGLSLAPILFGRLMDSHHPSWVFVLIGSFQTVALLTALRIGARTARGRLNGSSMPAEALIERKNLGGSLVR